MSSESQDKRPRGRRSDAGAPAGNAPAADIGEYASILRECLPENLKHFEKFFADPRRLQVMSALLQAHFTAAPGWVLNIGCGPFATELFVAPLRQHRIVSFDYTPGFAPAYPALRNRGHLSNVNFFIGDARSAEFAPESFDLIIMQDLLYEPALDFSWLFQKYDRYLRPGGLLFLTVLDMRTRRLWKLLGREKRYRRYDIPAVLLEIQDRDYQILDCVPNSLSPRGPLNWVFKQVLWRGFGLANEHAVLARKALSQTAASTEPW